MAYKTFNQRYPKFKWVLLLAVLLALPLTVFSVQNVSTQTQQHAYYPPSDGGSSVAAPQFTLITSKCITNPNGSKQIEIDSFWAPATNATNYSINYYKDGVWKGGGNIDIRYNPLKYAFFTQSRNSELYTIKLQASNRISGAKSSITVKSYQTSSCN